MDIARRVNSTETNYTPGGVGCTTCRGPPCVGPQGVCAPAEPWVPRERVAHSPPVCGPWVPVQTILRVMGPQSASVHQPKCLGPSRGLSQHMRPSPWMGWTSLQCVGGSGCASEPCGAKGPVGSTSPRSGPPGPGEAMGRFRSLQCTCVEEVGPLTLCAGWEEVDPTALCVWSRWVCPSGLGVGGGADGPPSPVGEAVPDHCGRGVVPSPLGGWGGGGGSSSAGEVVGGSPQLYSACALGSRKVSDIPMTMM